MPSKLKPNRHRIGLGASLRQVQESVRFEFKWAIVNRDKSKIDILSVLTVIKGLKSLFSKPRVDLMFLNDYHGAHSSPSFHCTQTDQQTENLKLFFKNRKRIQKKMKRTQKRGNGPKKRGTRSSN